MSGIVESGELCTVAPFSSEQAPEVGDVVLCKVKGKQYLHLVKATRGEQFLIGNNRGGVNGWTGRTQLYGKLIAVEP